MSTLPYEIEAIELADFSGGLNLRDSSTEIAPNETPEAMNFTLDERGAAVTRLGVTADGDMDDMDLPADIIATFYTKVENVWLIQSGARLYRRTAPGMFTEIDRMGGADAFTDDDPVAFVDFRTVADGPCVIIVHPDDGVLKWTGGTDNIEVVEATVKGTSAVVWANKVWVTGDGTSKVSWSESGDGETYDTMTGFNNIRDENDHPCIAVFGLPSVGTVGDNIDSWRGIVICKEDSTHRVIDPDTGDYITISPDLGVAGPRAAVPAEGRLYMVTPKGIAVTDGVSPPVILSGKLDPLFLQHFNLAARATACAFPCGGRILFSIARDSAAVPDITIETDPTTENLWFMTHDFGAISGGDGAGTPMHAVAGTGIFAETFSGDDDLGTPIAAYIESGDLALGGGIQFRVRRVLPVGRNNPGTLRFAVKADFDQSDGQPYDLDLSSDSHLWGEMGLVWGAPGVTWGGRKRQKYGEIWELGVMRRFRFRLSTSDAGSYSEYPLLGGDANVSGGCALYSLRIETITLGLA